MKKKTSFSSHFLFGILALVLLLGVPGIASAGSILISEITGTLSSPTYFQNMNGSATLAGSYNGYIANITLTNSHIDITFSSLGLKLSGNLSNNGSFAGGAIKIADVTITDINNNVIVGTGVEGWINLTVENGINVVHSEIGLKGDIPGVPLPAGAWLLGTGLFGLLGVRRRMNKKKS